MEESKPQNTPKKGNPALWIVLAVVVLSIIGAVLYYGDFFNTNTNTGVNTNVAVNENTNEVVNTNRAVNQNTNTTLNTNSAANTNTASIDTSGWRTFQNLKFSFSVQYPYDWTIWQSNYENSDLAYDPVYDVGFRPEGLQGSVLVVNVNRGTKDAILDSGLFGEEVNDVLDINGRVAIRTTANAYIIETDEYSYILQNNNNRDTSDLAIYDSMVNSFSIQ